MVLHLLAKTWISCVYIDFMQGAEQGMAVVKGTPSSATAPQRCPRVRSCQCQSPTGILLLLLWMEALARLGMRLFEGCSAAPAFSPGETARKMIQGKKVSGPQQEEPECRTVEWAEHGVDMGMPSVVWM